jgi:RND family efflux transporter MFP subunit
MTFGLILFLTIATCIGSGCQSNKSEAEIAPVTKEGPVSVGVHRVTEHTFHRQIEISADVLAHKQVTVISKVPGEVKKVFVSEGDRVRKGDLLLKLDQKDFRLALKQAKAQLVAARAGVTAAEIGLETVTAKYGRLARLRDKQVISESAYEDIEGSKRSTKAQVKLAEAQVQLAEVGLESARTNLSYTEIHAPFDGEVAKRMVDEGARLNAMPPTPIAILVDASELKIVGALSERDLPFVSHGTPVRVSIDALAKAPIEAKVDRVEPLVDPISRTAGVQVVLKNEDGNLQPGMSARLTLDLGARQAVAVPDDVVMRSEIENDTGIVFVVKDNIAFRRKVRLGEREGQLREITEGLKADEIVVRGGQEKLKDGHRVTIDKAKGEEQ